MARDFQVVCMAFFADAEKQNSTGKYHEGGDANGQRLPRVNQPVIRGGSAADPTVVVGTGSVGPAVIVCRPDRLQLSRQEAQAKHQNSSEYPACRYGCCVSLKSHKHTYFVSIADDFSTGIQTRGNPTRQIKVSGLY